ncbi:MAG TPA: hypothetical protein VN181_03880, partial [Thermoanaerobaculia bacterium]|nr:hypothetical protein [Thermoanaerobaculia bacterium]
RDDHARQTTRVVKELNRECDDIREKLGQSMQHAASLIAASHGKLDARLGQLQKLLQERVDEGLQGVQQRQESTDLSTRGVLAEITAQLAALDARTRTDAFVLAKRIGWAQFVGIATVVMILALFLLGR